MWVGREADEPLPARAEDQSHLSTPTSVLVAGRLTFRRLMSTIVDVPHR